MSEVILGYDDVVRLIEELVLEVGDDYGGVVGISRGGLPVAVELSHRLNIPMGAIAFSSYEDRQQTTLEHTGQFLYHVAGKPLLLVDDIVDSGTTLTAAFDKVTKYTDELETAVLHAKPGRAVDPDYYCVETKDWVVYPWEVQP